MNIFVFFILLLMGNAVFNVFLQNKKKRIVISLFQSLDCILRIYHGVKSDIEKFCVIVKRYWFFISYKNVED